MPLTSTPTYFGGPFRGMDDLRSARHLGPGDLVDGLNIVNEAGSLRPRPGYELARTQSLKFSPHLVISRSSGDLSGVAVDDTYIYHTDSAANQLRRVPRIGGTDASIASITSASGIDIDTANDTAYVTAASFEVKKITTVSGSPSVSTLLTGATTNFSGVAIDTVNDKIYLLKSTASPTLWSATLSTGSGLAQIATTGSANWVDVAVDTSGSKVYIADRDGSIWRCDLDGSNLEEWLTAVGDPRGITIDVANGRVYYTDDDNGAIKSVKTDGTESESIHSRTYTGGLRPIFYEPGTKQLFYGKPTSGPAIYRMNAHASVVRVLSMFSLERGLIGVPNGTFADDWVVCQMANESTGETDFVSWFPATDDSFVIPMGYHAADEDVPELVVSNNRDTDPTALVGFQSGFGRADFAYTGLSLNSAKGGVLIANGEGNGFFANYVMGNTIIRVTDFAASGNITLTINGVTTAAISDTTTAENLRITLSTTPGVNQVIVTKTGTAYNSSPVAQFDIEFIGGLSGQAVTVTINDGTTSATLTTEQAGGTETAHKMYLMPCGLPKPDVGGSSHNVQFIQTAVGASGSTLDGVYEYCATYYSSILGLESPRSVSSGYKDPHVSGGPDRVKFTINGLPDSIYFEGATSAIPFLLVDRIRIWRKRVGNNLLGSGLPDGGGQVDYDFFFVAEYDLKTAKTAGYPYDIGDDQGEEDLVTVAPNYGYPPEKAQYVAVHGSRAHWAPQTPGLQSIYYSELPRVTTGEPGHQYVKPGSVAVLENTRPSDHHTTSVISFGSQLVVHTNRDTFLVATDLIEFGTYQAARIPGGGGCAGKHLIVETDAMPELGGRLIWPNGRGDIYEFDGGSVRLISRSIRNLVRTLVRKTWQDVAYAETGNDTMYFGSAILDPEYARVIFSMFVDSGAASNAPIQLVFDLDTQSWTRWDIAAWGWHVIRKLTGSTGKGIALPVFSDASANLYKMQFGKGDAGSTFAWHAEFGDESFGTRRDKQSQIVRFGFETIDYGGAAASVRLDTTIVNKDRTVPGVHPATTLDNAGDLETRIDAKTFKHIRFKLSGTIADDQDHPRLVEREIELSPVGAQ